jgi:SAM-dependent methyltransferase
VTDRNDRRIGDVVRAAADRAAAALHRGPEGGGTQPQSPRPSVEQFARDMGVGQLAIERGAASARLRARLDDDDVVRVERAIAADSQLAHTWHHAPAEARGHLLLHFGVHVRDAAVLEKTGLRPEQPPETVHAMARGPLAAAGGLYEADLIADALASVGADLAAIGSGLDFGCSSGRVVRTLAAAFPATDWRGCDPNGDAIAWAQATLPGIAFFQSGDVPPLPLADGSLDLVCAISIWSHFAPALGLRWFDEMHRLLRPGGHLVFTTHGWTSIACNATGGARTPEQSEEIVRALYVRGWWFAAEFGDAGDWGVTNRLWGMAFLTPEWLLTQLLPHWRVLEFAPGRNLGNQDVYVLERF